MRVVCRPDHDCSKCFNSFLCYELSEVPLLEAEFVSDPEEGA